MASRDVRSAASWVDAAYQRFVSHGLSAVKVEALARDLGTTKGSFYWHFTDRRALIEAVMERWETLETEQIITIADRGGTAHEQLELLFRTVGEHLPQRGGEATLYVEAEAEGVREYVARVSRRRTEYVAGLLRAAGFEEKEAWRRGVIALATALGMQQLSVGTGDQLPGAAGGEVAGAALRMLLAR